jgi:hypothetical protein
MDEDTFLELENFYLKLDQAVRKLKKKKTKKKNHSLFLQILQNSHVDNTVILHESAMNCAFIPRVHFSTLLSNHLIREFDEENRYCITGHGIWVVETQNKIIDQNALLDYIDSKYFDKAKELREPLQSNHKVILLSMLALRAFSKDSRLDLHGGENMVKALKEVTEESYRLLVQQGIIEEKETLYGTTDTEPPLTNLYRHTDELRQRVYVARSGKKLDYYLDLYRNGRLDTELVAYCFRRLIGTPQKSIDFNAFYEFCKKIPKDKSIFIFNTEKHIFNNPKYDDVLREAIDQVKYSK